MFSSQRSRSVGNVLPFETLYTGVLWAGGRASKKWITLLTYTQTNKKKFGCVGFWEFFPLHDIFIFAVFGKFFWMHRVGS